MRDEWQITRWVHRRKIVYRLTFGKGVYWLWAVERSSGGAQIYCFCAGKLRNRQEIEPGMAGTRLSEYVLALAGIAWGTPFWGMVPITHDGGPLQCVKF